MTREEMSAYVASRPYDKPLQAMAADGQAVREAAESLRDALLDIGDHESDRIAQARSIEKRHGNWVAHRWLKLRDALAALDERQ